MAKLAFLGLGVMGAPMAAHLQKAGHDVTVYNRTTEKARAWAETHGGKMAETPKAAAEGAEIVFSCVGNDDDLRSVCVGDDGAFAGMGEGTIFVDHTTVSAAVTRELHAAADARQGTAEVGQAVIFERPALFFPCRMVAVLLAPAVVQSGRLQVALRIETDPDVAPGRGDRQTGDAFQRFPVLDRRAVGEAIGEAAPALAP